jgi:hypothetical protein
MRLPKVYQDLLQRYFNYYILCVPCHVWYHVTIQLCYSNTASEHKYGETVFTVHLFVKKLYF